MPGNASGHSDTTAAVRLRGDGPTLVVDDDRQRGDVLVMVRPEDIEIGAGDADPTRFPVHGIITSRMFVGSAFRYVIRSGDHDITVVDHERRAVGPVRIGFRPEKCRLFPADPASAPSSAPDRTREVTHA
ncbi:TOBE domain-containing protein [Gordonia sp. DT30]|uniref:TOBE domain-containing protein n=1 Tax=Gordonia sp. DT30 TaxID=3416546 RepID=UPI003CEF0621